MKYIKKIILENFQSHKYTVLNFTQGLNVVVGKSDSGKSSIIRAIKWVFYNEPIGDFFIRQGENNVKVSIILNDNTKVTRLRTPSKNQYIISQNNEDLILEGFGTGVPKEVKTVLGVDYIKFDNNIKSKVNIGEQLEGPFILSEKSSTRAKAIGKIVGVDIIDEALNEALRDLSRLKNNNKYYTKELEEQEKQLKNFLYLNELGETIENLKHIEKLILKKQDRLSKLKILLDNYKKNKKDQTYYKNKLDDLNNLEQLELIISMMESKLLTLNNYKRLEISFKKVKKDLSITKLQINKLDKVNIANTYYKSIDKKLYTYKSLFQIYKTYKDILRSKRINSLIMDKTKELNEMYRIHNDIERRYVELNKLKTYEDNLSQLKSSIDKGNHYMSKFKNMEQLESIYRDLYERIKLLNELNKIFIYAYRLEKDKKKNIIKVDSADKYIKKLLNSYGEILKKIKVCPYCLSNISENQINRLKDSFK